MDFFCSLAGVLKKFKCQLVIDRVRKDLKCEGLGLKKIRALVYLDSNRLTKKLLDLN